MPQVLVRRPAVVEDGHYGVACGMGVAKVFSDGLTVVHLN